MAKQQLEIYDDGYFQHCYECGENVNIKITELDYEKCVNCNLKFHNDCVNLYRLNDFYTCNECILEIIVE